MTHISLWFGLVEPFDPEILGLLPDIFRADDPRPGKQQVNERYQHGGGWQKQDKWKFNRKTKAITFPGDAPLMPLALTGLPLSQEVVALYPHGYVIIVHDDNGTFEVARMD